MLENRRTHRYSSLALSPDAACRILILTESAANIEKFKLLAKPRWSRAGYDSFEIGFQMEESPMDRSFQRYEDYLSWRTSNDKAWI